MPRPVAPAADKYLTFGLASLRSTPVEQAGFHRHNEVELLYVERGAITWLFGGQRLALREGHLVVFWGAVPHLTVDFEPHTILNWLTVPLAWFLQWQLPKSFSASILQGRVFRRRAVAGGAPAVLTMFQRWQADLGTDSRERHQLVVLEGEAFLRRLLVEKEIAMMEEPSERVKLQRREIGHVEAMASWIAGHYTDPIQLADVARVVGLHPDYAGALFRKTCGLSLIDYVTEQRISHAQRLLATTDAKIIEVAFAAGFRSVSRFYTAFTRVCGCTPRHYRRTLHAPRSPR